MTDLPDSAAGPSPAYRLLCVDDEPGILSSLRRVFRSSNYDVLTANSGAEGLQLLETERVDLIISDMRMPEMDGAHFLAQAKQRWPDSVRILLTGYADIESTVDAINKGEIYRYISKPWNNDDLLLVVRHALERKALEQEKLRLEALTARQNEELRDLNTNLERKVAERTEELREAHEKLKTSFLTSIRVFANLIELRGTAIAGHSRRVADLARRIAEALELDAADTQNVFLAALLHDIGKIGLPDAVLTRPVTHLSREELSLYRAHPVKGEQSLMALSELREAAKILRSHHERFDGGGFPDGLANRDIPIGARILAVANDFDGLQIGTLAMRRLNVEQAKKPILDGRGSLYDPIVVDAFVRVTSEAEPEHLGEEPVKPAHLQAGMVLARDLVSRDGKLLLAAGYRLDASLIRQIRDFAATETGYPPLFIRVQPKS